MNDFYSFGTQYGQADALFRAALSADKLRVNTLRANGTTLTDEVKQTLLSGGGSMCSNDPKVNLWYYYLTDLGYLSAEDFIYASRIFRDETGGPLYYSDTFGAAIVNILYEMNVFICITECYDLKRIKKKQTLQTIIRKNKTELLAICEKLGWLKNTKTRDELIEYAQQNNRIECVAWLLNFKNRTADFAAERARYR